MNTVVEKVVELDKDGNGFNNSMVFSPDSQFIATRAKGDNINIWDWRHRRIVKTITVPQSANDTLSTNSLIYSPDGKLFVACIGRGPGNIFIRVWSTTDWSIIKDITRSESGACASIVFTPDGKSLIQLTSGGGSGLGKLISYSVVDWREEWNLPAELSGESIAISPNGKQLAFAGSLWIVPSGIKDVVERAHQSRLVRQLSIVELGEQKIIKTIETSSSEPRIAWSPDGTQIAIVGGDYVEIVDVISGVKSPRPAMEEVSRGHANVRYSPDGRFFIYCDFNALGTGLGIRIWDHNHSKLLQQIAGNVSSVAISRDSKYLAAIEEEHVTVWQFK